MAFLILTETGDNSVQNYVLGDSTNNDHNTILERFEKSAIEYCNNQMKSYRIQQTPVIETFDEFDQTIVLKGLPVDNVVIKNDGTAIDSTLYVVNERIGLIKRVSGSPLKNIAKITVEYDSGWLNAAAVPENVKEAMRMFIKHKWREDRKGHDTFGKDAIANQTGTFSISRDEVYKEINRHLKPYCMKVPTVGRRSN